MSKFEVGKLLPNLNIICDQGNSTVSSVNVNSTDTDINQLEAEQHKDTEIIRPSLEPLVLNPKSYKSKDGGFVTGIDLLSEKNTEMLSKRAERFGLTVEESKPTIKALYESLGITEENKNAGKLKQIRLDTMHMRGVEELNTSDVLRYFQKYGPLDVEWINDYSCNIKFCDEASCARALLGMSTTFLPSFYDKIKSSEDSNELTEKSSQENESMDIDLSPEDVKIPVPPGNWRLGTKHPSAETILLRFATTGDKKLPGAESRSKYYQKYGNPNYEGLTGIISNSRKLKQQSAANKLALSKTKFVSDVQALKQDLQKTAHKRSVQMKQKSKPMSESSKIRPFMYADEEEKKLKVKRSALKRKSDGVHSRLGKKYTYDELITVGKSLRSDDDDSSSEVVSYNNSNKESSSDLRNKIKKMREGSFRKYNYRRHEDRDSTSYRRHEDRDSTSYRRRNDRDSVNYRRRNDRDSVNYRRRNDRGSISYNRHDDRDYINYESEENEPRNEFIANRRVQELKTENKRSYFKRKHRSPLIDDDDDDGDDSYSDSA